MSQFTKPVPRIWRFCESSPRSLFFIIAAVTAARAVSAAAGAAAAGAAALSAAAVLYFPDHNGCKDQEDDQPDDKS